jgi:hypothetical protein
MKSWVAIRPKPSTGSVLLAVEDFLEHRAGPPAHPQVVLLERCGHPFLVAAPSGHGLQVAPGRGQQVRGAAVQITFAERIRLASRQASASRPASSLPAAPARPPREPSGWTWCAVRGASGVLELQQLHQPFHVAQAAAAQLEVPGRIAPRGSRSDSTRALMRVSPGRPRRRRRPGSGWDRSVHEVRRQPVVTGDRAGPGAVPAPPR